MANNQKKQYVHAAKRMLWGKRGVISGFFIAVAGMIGYFLVSFYPEISNTFPNTTLTYSWLGVMGLGVLLWLIGSMIYMGGAMDSDPRSFDQRF